jgi:hypothetical protein
MLVDVGMFEANRDHIETDTDTIWPSLQTVTAKEVRELFDLFNQQGFANIIFEICAEAPPHKLIKTFQTGAYQAIRKI